MKSGDWYKAEIKEQIIISTLCQLHKFLPGFFQLLMLLYFIQYFLFCQNHDIYRDKYTTLQHIIKKNVFQWRHNIIDLFEYFCSNCLHSFYRISIPSVSIDDNAIIRISAWTCSGKVVYLNSPRILLNKIVVVSAARRKCIFCIVCHEKLLHIVVL